MVALHSGERPALLCISQSFFPDTTPTAIRAGKLLTKLSADWEITVVSEALGPGSGADMRVETARSWRPRGLLAVLRRLRLDKLLELFIWPDESIFWVLPAIFAGRRLVREFAPRAIVVFMMPYSTGLVGVVLSRLTGLPLVLNFDDSLTCTDMHPEFPTRLHHRMARALEDFYARSADAAVYVSVSNLELVRSRQPEDVGERFHLVRYGADASESLSPPPSDDRFEVAYVGAMSGWWALIEQNVPVGGLRGVYGAWMRFGRHRLTALDPRSSSPAVVGRAILEAIAEHPDWEGRVRLVLYGNLYPLEVVDRALESAGVASVVTVHGPLPHEQVADVLARADLLLITLPARLDGSRGGRISAKTYEYLATDRPILAAVPRGENWDYLESKPGVWLADPLDEQRMKEVIAELVQDKLSGRARAFDRRELRNEISYDTRAMEFERVIGSAIERRSRHGRPHRALR